MRPEWKSEAARYMNGQDDDQLLKGCRFSMRFVTSYWVPEESLPDQGFHGISSFALHDIGPQGLLMAGFRSEFGQSRSRLACSNDGVLRLIPH